MTIKEVFEFKKGRQITHPVRVGEREYWLNTYIRRLMDEEGTIYAVLGISRDITDRKKMEEQSYYTEKLASIGTLAAGVAHEINNPLAVILGFTDLLVEKAEPDSETYETLKTIERQGLNAKRVVENLLSFSRYSERKVEMVDVNECMRAVLKVMGNRLHLEKINVKAELEEGLPTVRGNAGEIQQVFFNLQGLRPERLAPALICLHG
jgi:signal transduction histidine kinase